MAAAVAAWGKSPGIRHVRDEQYLSWRYRNPRAIYRFVTWGSGEIEGYMVLQNIPGRFRSAIVDWEAPDPEVRDGLLDFVTQGGNLGSLRTWSATLPVESVAALRATGFNDTFDEGLLRFAGRMLVKPLQAAGGNGDPFAATELTRMDTWDLRMIYSDAL